MKTIPVLIAEGENGPVAMPATPIPMTAVRVVCDGTDYLVYEEGDE